jgi:hypothetical protein
MFWTITIAVLVALCVAGYLFDRRAKGRHEVGTPDVGNSPRYGAGDAMGRNYGNGVISGHQGGRIDLGGPGA